MDTINSLWLGHFSLATLAAMVADMCESLSCRRELATDSADITEALEQLVEEAEDINETLAQIAIAVAYCESAYGIETTTEALAEAGAYPDVIAEAQRAQQVQP
jgi:hypothetical protein